jgi:hypothetical protein
VDPKLGQDIRHVVSLCPKAYVQPLGDTLAILALGQSLQNLFFPICELLYGLTSFVLLLPCPRGIAEHLYNLF